MTRGRKIAGNFLWLSTARALDTLSNFVLIAIVARYLGVEGFGIFSFYMAIAWTLYPFFILSLPRVLVRDIAQDAGRAPELIGNALSIVMLVAVPLALMCYVGGALILDDAQTAVLMLLLASLAVMTLTRVLNSAYIALERMHYEVVIGFIVTASYLALTALAVHQDMGMMYIFAAFLAANALGLVASLYVSMVKLRIVPALRLKRGVFNYIAAESIPMIASQGLMQAYLYSGVFVIKSMRGAFDLGIFQAPFRIINRIQSLPITVVLSVTPLLAQLAVTDRRRLAEVQGTLIKLLLLSSIGITLAGYHFAAPITRLVFGPDFGEAVPIFRIQVLALAFGFVNINFEALLVNLQRQGRLVIIYSIALAASLALNVAFVPEYGAMGASLIILLTQALMLAGELYCLSDVLRPREIASGFIKPLAAGCAAFAPLMYFEGSGIAALAASLGAFCVMVLALRAFTRDEIRALRGLMRSRRRGPADGQPEA